MLLTKSICVFICSVAFDFTIQSSSVFIFSLTANVTLSDAFLVVAHSDPYQSDVLYP